MQVIFKTIKHLPVYEERKQVLNAVMDEVGGKITVIAHVAAKISGGKDLVVLNGPDEQYVAGRMMGTDGGIGGTYGVICN